MNPLWNGNVVAGVSADGRSFLAYSDLLGSSYEDDAIATGYGAYLAIPLLRQALAEVSNPEQIEEAQAVALLERCLRVLYYRDARSSDQVQMAKVTLAGGVQIGSPYTVSSDWSIA